MIKQQLLRGFKECHGSQAEHKSKLCSVERGRHHIRVCFTILPVKDWRWSPSVAVPGGFWMPALETPNWEQSSPFRVCKGVVRVRISDKTRGRRWGDRGSRGRKGWSSLIKRKQDKGESGAQTTKTRTALKTLWTSRNKQPFHKVMELNFNSKDELCTGGRLIKLSGRSRESMGPPSLEALKTNVLRHRWAWFSQWGRRDLSRHFPALHAIILWFYKTTAITVSFMASETMQPLLK